MRKIKVVVSLKPSDCGTYCLSGTVLSISVFVQYHQVVTGKVGF